VFNLAECLYKIHKSKAKLMNLLQELVCYMQIILLFINSVKLCSSVGKARKDAKPSFDSQCGGASMHPNRLPAVVAQKRHVRRAVLCWSGMADTHRRKRRREGEEATAPPPMEIIQANLEHIRANLKYSDKPENEDLF